MKGQKVETILINGKKYYSVTKKDRTYIFDEESRLVDKNGKQLPPPPPPPPKQKAKVKEGKIEKNKMDKM